MRDNHGYGRLGELISLASDQGLGITVQPLSKGERIGGFGSDDYSAFDGWIVGTITSVGGDSLSVGETLAEAVEAALEVWEAHDG